MAELWAVTSAHSYISIKYEEEQDWFYVKWCGHINSDDVVTVAQTYLELQKEKRCPKLLNDKSEVTGEWEEANDWLEYEWKPDLEETGLVYMAMVLSRDMHDLVAAQDLQRRLSSLINVSLFYDLATAKAWLANPSKPA
ncbi:hypothetical protein [Rufibacter hautae]|uniref:STAS/SEC14 domain-containing protein n=1 Tax=Rufibacter hautae TaxID=2595005 RepID=A0A5B6TEW9_9BACT|nr:hypothetical protein [Rufibacter hautae]KAA3439184.1 hypothetical protein FOA19_00415 [Rufibacter hautae]